jgi:hypothetical protein
LLKSIVLPPALSEITGAACVGSSIRNVAVDDENPNYSVSGAFVIAPEGRTLI